MKNDDLVERSGKKRCLENDDVEVLPILKRKFAPNLRMKLDLRGETMTPRGAKSISGKNPSKKQSLKPRKKKTIIQPRGQLRIDDVSKSHGNSNFSLKE